MFNLANRRYTGAKTKLLEKIDSVLSQSFLDRNHKEDYATTKTKLELKRKTSLGFKSQLQTNIHSNLDSDLKPCLDSLEFNNKIFFDVFAGTGVVSEYFLQKDYFTHFIMNDFLYANYAIYQGFFAKDCDESKILSFQHKYQNLDSTHHNNHTKDSKQNYYSLHFGNKFFSLRDAFIIGAIRDDLDKSLESKAISKNEFYILLASLLYSTDRIANTVGHYDAYRKNVNLQDRFQFELIKPIKTDKKIEIFREDSNTLVKILKAQFLQNKQKIKCVFIDPPYNSRQYSRFYHLLETLSKNDKPKLYGEALKPTPENISNYCTTKAKESFKDLIENLAKITRNIVVTYNNTYNSKSNSSRNKIKLDEINDMLEPIGKTQVFEFDYKAFSSGKTDFKEHKEIIFISEIQ